MIHDARHLQVRMRRLVQHIFQPIGAVGNLHRDPVGLARLHSPVPVQTKAKQVAVEMIFGVAVVHQKSRMNHEAAISRHMIHAGFLVYNRDAEDHFYRDLLGFRLYWHGGMQPGQTDWVAMQVPDGTDWLEYM